MRTKIISIGNSRGIRIPKILLEETGITEDVTVKVTDKGLTITPVKPAERAAKGTTPVNETALLSEKMLAQDWNRPDEDEAWKNL